MRLETLILPFALQTRPTSHEAPALLKHHLSASLALLKLLALLLLLALSKLLALSYVSFWSHPRVILESY